MTTRRMDAEAPRERDPELVRFARRVGLVAGAAVSVVFLSRLLLATATSDVRATLHEETRARVVGDSLEALQRSRTDQRLDRMASIMELVVFVVAEQSSPEERREALSQLRRMRRITP